MDFGYSNNHLIKDWKNNVVLKINEKENIKEISGFALHLARIISYPTLDIEY